MNSGPDKRERYFVKDITDWAQKDSKTFLWTVFWVGTFTAIIVDSITSIWR